QISGPRRRPSLNRNASTFRTGLCWFTGCDANVREFRLRVLTDEVLSRPGPTVRGFYVGSRVQDGQLFVACIGGNGRRRNLRWSFVGPDTGGPCRLRPG